MGGGDAADRPSGKGAVPGCPAGALGALTTVTALPGKKPPLKGKRSGSSFWTRRGLKTPDTSRAPYRHPLGNRLGLINLQVDAPRVLLVDVRTSTSVRQDKTSLPALGLNPVLDDPVGKKQS